MLAMTHVWRAYFLSFCCCSTMPTGQQHDDRNGLVREAAASPQSPPPPPAAAAAMKRKHNLTPSEQQALHLEKLLANPDREVFIPKPAREKELRAPREQMKNVSGSSAGAGSGEFHVYKHSRRREYERIKLMEEKAKREEDKAAFEARQQALQEQVSAKTNKNRLKREKKKGAKLAAKSGPGAVTPGAASNTSTNIATGQEKDSSEVPDDDHDDEEQGKRKRINAEGVAQVVFRKRQDDESDDE